MFIHQKWSIVIDSKNAVIEYLLDLHVIASSA